MVKYFDGFGKEVTGYVQTLEEEKEKLKEENWKLKMKVTVLEDTLSVSKSTPKKKEKKTVE